MIEFNRQGTANWWILRHLHRETLFVQAQLPADTGDSQRPITKIYDPDL